MLPKPPSCEGCPLSLDREGFVGDEIVPGARVFILGQNPGESEEKEGKPFVGQTGQAMIRDYFPLAGLQRGVNVSIGNALRCRWQHSNSLPPEKVLQKALAHCTREHLRIPPEVTLVIAQGALAARVMGCPGKISEWRGYSW